jgi:hypothetical protein
VAAFWSMSTFDAQHRLHHVEIEPVAGNAGRCVFGQHLFEPRRIALRLGDDSSGIAGAAPSGATHCRGLRHHTFIRLAFFWRSRSDQL